jgi:syntaxin 16
VRRASGVDSQFASLDSAIAELQGLYLERLRPTFESRHDVEARISAVTSTIASGITRLRNEIKGAAVQGDASRKRLESAMQKGHASRLQRIVVQFKEMQTDHLKKLQTTERRDTFGVAGSISIADDDLSVDPDIDVSFTANQVAQAMETRVEIDQRNRQIAQLLPMIQQLQEMFADLATLIVEQGTMLDRIDGLLEAAVDDMVEGNTALAKAEEHQKASSKWFIIYMIGMIILILILGSVILIRKNKRAEPTE